MRTLVVKGLAIAADVQVAIALGRVRLIPAVFKELIRPEIERRPQGKTWGDLNAVGRGDGLEPAILFKSDLLGEAGVGNVINLITVGEGEVDVLGEIIEALEIDGDHHVVAEEGEGIDSAQVV